MNPTTNPDWQAEVGRELSASFGHLRLLLGDKLGDSTQLVTPPTSSPVPSTMQTLCERFGLSEFERDLLLLCAGVEMDSALAQQCAEMNGDALKANPTFGLAFSVLPLAHWSASAPSSPLRRWRLVEVGNGETLTRSPLRIDERVLHFLAGLEEIDPRLEGMIAPVETDFDLFSEHRTQEIERATALLRVEDSPLIALCNADRASLLAFSCAVAEKLEKRLFRVRAFDLPKEPKERFDLARVWAREARLSEAILLVETDGDAGAVSAFSAFADQGDFPLVLASEWPVLISANRRVVRLPLQPDTPFEQANAWRRALGKRSSAMSNTILSLSSQFRLPAPVIRSATEDAFASLPEKISSKEIEKRLWEASRRQARLGLDDLAQRVETKVTWNDIVLPEQPMRTLQQIAAHVSQQRTVYEDWDFGAQGRGIGASVIFAGGSGTGKTLAAEILANALNLDLYRIDLSAVVSKYIGETEKNLRRIFAAAEQGGAILLFDEADALFGKRSEVKDSHDRYANLEVSFLLQQMETYRGLAVLTTNLLENFDRAFLRRVRFVVQFPFPSPDERAQIWRKTFPKAAPTHRLDFQKLSRLNVTGGNIRNIAINAAFLAAHESQPIKMKHLLRAASSEFAKLDKPLPDSEIFDWVEADA